MKVTVLSDNIAAGSLQGEWGLSLLVEYKGKKILLDTGGSDKFISNAKALGLDVAEVDLAVLSHAHYDHSLGMQAFFEANARAPFFISPNAGENCYSGRRPFCHYIGLPKGVLPAYATRIRRPSGIAEISDGVFIVPHSTPGLAEVGARSHHYVRKGWRLFPDDYSHEQSLVIKEDDGLVIFNSCSHSGPDVIIAEVRRVFPDEPVKAYVGGLHLFRLNAGEVRKMGERIQSAGIARLYTGHCTGDEAFRILHEQLGPGVEQFRCGMQIVL